MRHLKFRKKRKRAPHKAKLHFLSEKIHWNKKAVALWIAEIAVVCALAFILVFYFGQRVSNAGDSMRPELKNGDVVLVNRLVDDGRIFLHDGRALRGIGFRGSRTGERTSTAESTTTSCFCRCRNKKSDHNGRHNSFLHIIPLQNYTPLDISP